MIKINIDFGKYYYTHPRCNVGKEVHVFIDFKDNGEVVCSHGQPLHKDEITYMLLVYKLIPYNDMDPKRKKRYKFVGPKI